jgi:hypothetical protein
LKKFHWKNPLFAQSADVRERAKFVRAHRRVRSRHTHLNIRTLEEYGLDQQWLTAQKRERHQHQQWQWLLLKGLLWPTLALRITPIAALLH